ncbi:MAG: hypothetical protein V3R76_08320 [Gammaproteobacteria bacterium]
MNFSKAVLKTKFKATGIHLSMSLVVFFILAYQIFFVWYPQPYFSVDGGWQGIRIVAAVDLVLGPLITFLIFDLTKSRKEIIFDLFVIVTVQIGALIYGVVTTYEQRPVAIILIDDFVISALERDYGSQLESLEDLNRYSSETPPIIYANIPYDRDVIEEITRIKTELGITEHVQIQLYQPLSKLVSGLEIRQPNYLGLIDDFGQGSDYEHWLEKHNRQPDGILVALFRGRYGEVWLVFDRDGKYLGYF